MTDKPAIRSADFQSAVSQVCNRHSCGSQSVPVRLGVGQRTTSRLKTQCHQDSELVHPEGMVETSPAFQRWDQHSRGLSPEGTVEARLGQPSLRDWSPMARPPSVETLGYCPSSLRDGLRAALANPAGSRLQTCDTADYKSALRPRGIGVLARHRVWLALAVGGLPAFCSLAILAAEQTNNTTLRDEWVDADTGHRVVRLSRVPGTSESFYFHQNAFTAEGDKMVFVNRAPGGRDRLFVLDLATRQSEPLTEPGVRGGVVGRTSRRGVLPAARRALRDPFGYP